VKLFKFVWVGVFVCLFSVGVLSGAPTKAIDFSEVNWVTQNPPTCEDFASSVHVIEFWATWCKPCIKQMPHMMTLAKEYESHNVIFTGISVDRSIKDVRKFVEKKKINYHIAMDNGLSDTLGVDGIPRAFIISHEAKILWSGNPSDAKFEGTLKSAVNAAPKAMLAGVDLGQFSHLRIKLCGGRNFAKAYLELEDRVKNGDSSEKIFAGKILDLINTKLSEKIAAAQLIQIEDPKAALQIYKEIIDNYSGINLTIKVEPVYLELQKKTKITAHMPEIIPAEAKNG